MTAHKPNTTVPTAQLFCLATLGHGDGIRHTTKTDLTPAIPFSVDTGWYEAYCYDDCPRSPTCQEGNMLRGDCASAWDIAENMFLSVARKVISLVWRSATPGVSRTSLT